MTVLLEARRVSKLYGGGLLRKQYLLDLERGDRLL